VNTASEDRSSRSASLAKAEAASESAGGAEESASEAERNMVEQVAKLYPEMSARNAAQIMEQLREPLAVELLQKLPTDARASILGKMDPKKAARLTELMAGPTR
jgi:flagellar motility protein MotE (MotC chaperone)